MSSLTENLDVTITAAVKAQVEAKVLEALSGSDFFGKMVASALQAPVQVKDPKDSYRSITVPYIDNVIGNLIREATRQALEKIVEEERYRIESSVRVALRDKLDKFAESVTDQVLEQTKSKHFVKVDIAYKPSGGW